MAKSKYEYVKEFELDDKLPPNNWIVVRIDGSDFRKFSTIHEFKKPNDENALKLMTSCASSMLEHFPDIVFAYGVSDEYSFVWKETTKFYQRRASKILSLSVSFFTSVYVTNWRDFFPHKELAYSPSFDGRVFCYPNSKRIRDYLVWRQEDCHGNNQYNTCFWKLVESGRKEQEAHDLLKGTGAAEKNELLHQQFGVNYNDVPSIFRKGTCVYRKRAEVEVKTNAYGEPVKRMRTVVTTDNIDIDQCFWSQHPEILAEE